MFGKILFAIYSIILFIRKNITSPLMFKFFITFIYKHKNEDIWSKIKSYDIKRFKLEIDKYEYKPDLLFGIFDMTFGDPNFFFDLNRNSFRDCDDFSEIWYLWAIEHGYSVEMKVIIDGFKFWRSHVFIILKDEYLQKPYIFINNNEIMGRFSNIDEIIEMFKTENILLGGNFTFPIVLNYKSNDWEDK